MEPSTRAWRLRFWGVRGSAPSPGPGTVRYGGHTACIAVEPPEPGSGALVLDAGTGLRPCAAALEGAGVTKVDICLSHVHADHVAGLPWCAPLYRPGVSVTLHGPETVAEAVTRAFHPAAWPVATTAQLGVRAIAPGEAREVMGWTATTARLAHPGTTLGWRFDRPKAAFAYLTDNELGGGHGVGPEWTQGLVDFLRGVGTLVHDATNAPAQAAARQGWGHSTPLEAVSLAARAGCSRVVLFHHDPGHDDRRVDSLLAEARQHAASIAPGLMVEAAAEGMTLTLDEEG